MQDNIHIVHLACAFNKNPQELISQIELAQKANREKTFSRLKKEHPSLVEYDTLFKERGKMSGFKAEQVDKLLLVKAREIINDKVVYTQLLRELPQFAQSLLLTIKSHDLNRGRER